MNKLLAFFAFNVVLAAGYLSAEVFENQIDYTLPATNQKWKVGYELKNDKIKMAAFIPEMKTKKMLQNLLQFLSLKETGSTYET